MANTLQKVPTRMATEEAEEEAAIVGVRMVLVVETPTMVTSPVWLAVRTGTKAGTTATRITTSSTATAIQALTDPLVTETATTITTAAATTIVAAKMAVRITIDIMSSMMSDRRSLPCKPTTNRSCCMFDYSIEAFLTRCVLFAYVALDTTDRRTARRITTSATDDAVEETSVDLGRWDSVYV
jgi:hypothetical protein